MDNQGRLNLVVDGSDGDVEPRFERLFGTNVPANAYSFTRREFKVNSTGNRLGFEDSQSPNYTFPTGSPFSANVPANTETRSDTISHFLTLYCKSASTGR